MKKKQILNIVLLIGITGLVLFFSLKDQFQEILYQILHLNLFWLITAFFLIFLYWIFRAISLYTVIQKFKPSYTFASSFRLTLVTQFFNAVTPFATGGQPFQVYSLKKDGISITSGTNIIMQNFIVYQVALVLLGILAVLYNSIFHVFKEATILKHLVTLGFMINTLVVVFLFLIAFAKKMNRLILKYAILLLSKLHLVRDKEQKLKEWNTYIETFHTGAKRLLADKKMFTFTVLANFISLLCLYLVPLALLYGMGHYEINVMNCLASSAYTMLMGSFVPIPGGTGGLEYGYTKFFGNFVKGPILNASMLLWRGITYYLGLTVGAIALNMKQKRK